MLWKRVSCIFVPFIFINTKSVYFPTAFQSNINLEKKIKAINE